MRSAVLTLALTSCSSDKSVGVYNTAPSVSIVSPADGSSFNEGEIIEFQARVADDFDDPGSLLLTWSSDLDGELSAQSTVDDEGNVSYTTANLSPGNHAIMLLAVDSGGDSDHSSIGVSIIEVEQAPVINLVHPNSADDGYEGEPFEFVVQVSDVQDAPEDIALSFRSDIDGVFCTPTADAAGVASCEQELSPNEDGEFHNLVFTATDTDGNVTNATWLFTVIPGTQIDDDGDLWTEEMGDCDDTDPNVNPAEDENCTTEADDDCDGTTNNERAIGCVDYYYDLDGDGYGDDGVSERCLCEPDGNYTALQGDDCNDAQSTTNPGATETCATSADDDCDGDTNDAGAVGCTTRYYDGDRDGYGSAYVASTCTCSASGSYDSTSAGDCDDGLYTVHPGATESCSTSYDDDCDGDTNDEGASGCVTYYYDYDGDGYGSDSVSGRCLCATDGYYTSASRTDCYDYNASANPAATTYSSSSRGDGSYDWNCDGSQTKYYTTVYDCDADWYETSCNWSTSGFASSSSIPSCGSTGTYKSGCDTDYLSSSCWSTSSSSVTQKCL